MGKMSILRSGTADFTRMPRWIRNARSNCRFSTRKGVRQEAANRFANTPKTIVFGCAGVNTLLDERVTIGEGSLIGFLFSEVVTLGGKPAFANLMLSKIVFGGEPKQSQS